MQPHFSTGPQKPDTSTQNAGPDYSRRLAFLELGPADAERLRAAAASFSEWSDEFVERFYRHLFAFDETARFLQHPARVERLKQMQREHLESMLEAQWDDAYYHRRTRVGQAHAEVGIEPEFFLGAYCQYLQYSFERFAEDIPDDVPRYKDQTLSLLKAIFFDLGLTLDAYFAQSTENLRHALDMFWRANAELRQFAQLASHDLKTPLATVANLCDEAVDEFGTAMPEPAKQLIEAAKARIFRMSRMIDELLASAIAPDQDDSNQEIPSQEALHEAIETVRPLLEQNKIELTVPESLPWVWGNKIRLRESFANLLSNAAKFIDRRPGRILIEAHAAEDHCVFVVADNGPGIPADELQRIFAPFRRLPMHRDRPGSGLGLYFTKSLVEQQGGRIWVESEPGKGSRFCIELNRVRSPDHDTSDKPQS